ncbi:MAG: 2-isopropylmalate synthase [Nanoarchaeota archaeon]|nr:2-isopropylmalate synthase [Nanoarchaeota archaeon]MBU1321265.1 2-isopropylmalate synthase [Nanoarchaeota archaeon]MBU1597336.1 2-isopropylmalate synthase [Nanoarchaeota archaeon]MBU2441459.1 2-isopropylmalate synthase [Nanoarchaeota archaeon]
MVQILDATLREGEQTPGVYFDNHIKLAIADRLDKIGVDYIEAGHPAVSKEIYHAVNQIAGRNLSSVVAAHSRSLKKDVDFALECGVGFLGIFYCVSNGRLNGIFEKTLPLAIDQISKTIAYAREQNPDLIIRYTPEDTVRSEFSNVVDVSVAAVNAGADIISVADTTGFMIPGTERSMYDYVSRLRDAFDKNNVNPKIAVHCHNDRGLALANALDGYRAGAEIIDATILGIGERAGLVDLATLLAVLKTDFKVENNWDLARLPELYKLVSEYARIPIPVNAPITGANAFTHCAGVHTHAAASKKGDPIHYQSISPEIVGRESEVSLDHMSGLSSVIWALERVDVPNPDEEFVRNILEKVKIIGQKRPVSLDELRHMVESCEGEMVRR